jgi:hypothetical protein
MTRPNANPRDGWTLRYVHRGSVDSAGCGERDGRCAFRDDGPARSAAR